MSETPVLASRASGSSRDGVPGARLLKAVVLDWAGTTQDFGSMAPVGAFVEVFHRFGVEITAAQARGPMGLFKLDHIRALAAEPAIARDWVRIHMRPIDEDDIQEMYQASRSIQEDILPAYGQLIPGTLEAVAAIRERGYRVASTTGYPRSAGAIAAEAARRQGYEPDVMVCADEVPAGRPEPWMLLRALETLRVFPPSATVKVGDTRADIGEGLNAGTWTVGISRTGNYVGLSEAELEALPVLEQRRLVDAAAGVLRATGAHFVIESIAGLPEVLDEIEIRMARGEGPGSGT
jgi:phosphonoacetaldehyde hydrolase